MPKSMTGFSRQETQASWGVMSCEIRSVNHRYLEPSIRLPEIIRAIEPEIREQLRKRLHRGKVEVTFQVVVANDTDESLSIDSSVLNSLVSTLRQIESLDLDISAVDPIRLLQWPGVLEQAAPNTEQIQATAKALLIDALDTLLAHRQREGDELVVNIETRIHGIVEELEQIRAAIPAILTAQKQRLEQRLAEYTQELDPQRLEQEVVLLMNKADVMEELDRLDIHLAEVRHILRQKGAVGRRLDFMMQELNREANTLSSKSIASETTQSAVSIKVLIEQMREQIQNIE